jgi:LPS-assembly lipoprotein
LSSATALLAGCGFHIRQPAQLAFKSISLVGFAPRSPLAEALQRELASSVRVVQAPTAPDVVLRALQDSRERTVVASTSAAQVRELQLRITFNFRADTASGRELIPRVELLIKRDLSYRETAALAKEQEEAELFRDMQADVVAQVLRRLASVTL